MTFTGSSPYAIPSQPPFNNVYRGSVSSRPTRTYSPLKPSSPPTSYRKSSMSSVRSSSSSSTRSNSSSSLLASYNNDLRASSPESDSSLGGGIKSLMHRATETREEKAARKASKERRKQVERAEREAYERAQEMEATALYMAWRHGDGPNTSSYAMY